MSWLNHGVDVSLRRYALWLLRMSYLPSQTLPFSLTLPGTTLPFAHTGLAQPQQCLASLDPWEHPIIALGFLLHGIRVSGHVYGADQRAVDKNPAPIRKKSSSNIHTRPAGLFLDRPTLYRRRPGSWSLQHMATCELWSGRCWRIGGGRRAYLDYSGKSPVIKVSSQPSEFSREYTQELCDLSVWGPTFVGVAALEARPWRARPRRKIRRCRERACRGKLRVTCVPRSTVSEKPSGLPWRLAGRCSVLKYRRAGRV